jgi:hypothetical protein
MPKAQFASYDGRRAGQWASLLGYRTYLKDTPRALERIITLFLCKSYNAIPRCSSLMLPTNTLLARLSGEVEVLRRKSLAVV